jgi:hypothetical protein
MYRIKFMPMFRQVFQGISPVELERVTRHWLNVNAHDLEPSPVVAHTRAALTAEQVQ